MTLKCYAARKLKILVKNGDFLDRLEAVVTEILAEMDLIRAVTEIVRKDAQIRGYA